MASRLFAWAAQSRKSGSETRCRRPSTSTLRHRDDALRVRVGQGPEQHALDDAEDRGRRADAKPQHRDGGRGEPRRSRQQAQAVPQVRDEVFERPGAPRIAALLLDPVEAAHRQTRAARGLGRREAGVHVLPGLVLEMVAKLLVQFLFDRATADERSQDETADRSACGVLGRGRGRARRPQTACATTRWPTAAVCARPASARSISRGDCCRWSASRP